MKCSHAHPSIFTMIILAVFFAAHFFMFPTLTPQQDPFQAPFDFDQFLSELESALAKIEQEEKEKKPEDQTPSTKEDMGWPSKASPTTLPTLGAKPEISDEKKDPVSLFLEPAMQPDTSKNGQKSTELTKESIKAYSTVMDEFINHLNSIKNKVGNIQSLSPSFKEEFSLFYQHLIETIVVAHQHIKSKKAYQRLFLAPPEANKQLATDMKKLRQMIVDTAKKIKKLDQQLAVQDEEVESTETLLRKLAGQYLDTEIPPVTPTPTPPTRKRSYRPTKDSQAAKPSFKIANEKLKDKEQ